MLTPTLSMSQARMDRFTYLSQIGLCVALTWAAAEPTPQCRGCGSRAALGGGHCAGGVGHRRARPMRILARQPDVMDPYLGLHLENSLAETNLGLALASQGKFDEAIEHYQTALR